MKPVEPLVVPLPYGLRAVYVMRQPPPPPPDPGHRPAVQEDDSCPF